MWDFNDFATDDLERLIEIHDEMVEMGLDGLNEDMMAEVHAELARRDDGDDEHDNPQTE